MVVTPWPPIKTGVSFYSLNLYKEVAKVAKVTIIGSKSSDASSSEGLKIIQGWSPGALGAFQALKHCIKNKGDIFHIQAELIVFRSVFGTFLLPFIIFTLRLTGRPVVVTLHGINLAPSGTLTYEPDNLRLRLFKRLTLLAPFFVRIHVMLVCAIAHRIVVHSELMKKALERYGIRGTKIVTIPHGVKRTVGSEHLRGISLSRKLLFLGFLRPSKGLEYLIKAFRKVTLRFPNLRLVIVGGSPSEGTTYRVSLRGLVKDLGLKGKVKISEGMVPERGLEHLIASSDLIILPYLDYFLETSGALAEVMDYGKPVICTYTPRFFGDLVPGRECLMVQPGDVEGLSEAILTLVENRELAKMIGLNLRRKAQARYWDITAQRHFKDVYEPLVVSVL